MPNNGGHHRGPALWFPLSKRDARSFGRVEQSLSGLAYTIFSPFPTGFPSGALGRDAYSIETLNPLRTGLAPLTHPAPNRHLSPGITSSSPSRSSPLNGPASGAGDDQGTAGRIPNSAGRLCESDVASSETLDDVPLRGTSSASSNCH